MSRPLQTVFLITGLLLATAWSPAQVSPVQGDVDGDGYVGPKDLIVLHDNWGQGRGRTAEVGLTNLPQGARPIRMVRISPTSFSMGAPESEISSRANERPVHDVVFDYEFWISDAEITQAQWVSVMGSLPAGIVGSGRGEGDNYPVFNVSWEDCENFVDTLNAMSRKGIRKGSYRLPSEAEWELCCKAGTETRFSFGDSTGCPDGFEDCPAGVRSGDRTDYMWYGGNASFTPGENGYGVKEVATKPANPFGIHDLHGNLREWVHDWAHGDYMFAPSNGLPWDDGPTGLRILRGGCWFCPASECRSSYRTSAAPDTFATEVGFRIVNVSAKIPDPTATPTETAAPSPTATPTETPTLSSAVHPHAGSYSAALSGDLSGSGVFSVSDSGDVSGSVTSQFGTAAILGTVSLSGKLHGFATEGGNVTVIFEGSFSGDSGSGNYLSIDNHQGSWAATLTTPGGISNPIVHPNAGLYETDLRGALVGSGSFAVSDFGDMSGNVTSQFGTATIQGSVSLSGAIYGFAREGGSVTVIFSGSFSDGMGEGDYQSIDDDQGTWSATLLNPTNTPTATSEGPNPTSTPTETSEAPTASSTPMEVTTSTATPAATVPPTPTATPTQATAGGFYDGQWVITSPPTGGGFIVIRDGHAEGIIALGFTPDLAGTGWLGQVDGSGNLSGNILRTNTTSDVVGTFSGSLTQNNGTGTYTTSLGASGTWSGLNQTPGGVSKE